MKALSEVMVKLAERYDGPISQREGNGGKTFSYIAWTETVRRLNEVFGIFGWSTSAPVVMLADGVYTVSLSLVVRVLDDETGTVIEKSAAGVGSSVARQNDDNASKSALSDAISRAAKLLGDQFGFFLYEEKGATGQKASTSNYSAPRQSEAPRQIKDPSALASDAQKGFLSKLGYKGNVEGLSKGEASEIINSLKQQQTGGF